MIHVAPGRIDWWFGFLHHSEEHRWWYPRDHAFRDWEASWEPREYLASCRDGAALCSDFEGEDAMPYVQKLFGDSEASRELVIVSTEEKNELDTLRPACEHRSNDLSVYLWSLSCWMKAFVQK